MYGLKHLENLIAWNKAVVVKDGESWTSGKEYLKTARSIPVVDPGFDFLEKE